MNNIKVSICVPIYGVEKYIEKCAISLFEQTYTNIEYIFVNDCTRDKSMDILLNIVDRYPKRKPFVTILNNVVNKGLAATRNVAISAATGEFILHVDSDDYIDINTVEKCVFKQQVNNSDIVSFGCYREYNDKTVKQLPPLFEDSEDMCLSLIKKKKDGNIINCGIWGRLIRRTLYLDNNIEAIEGANMAEDYQVITRLAYFAKNIDVIQEPLSHYNLQNSGSYVNNISLRTADQSENSFNIVYNFFKDKGDVFLDAVNIALVEHVFRMIVNGLDNSLGRDFYYRQRLRLDIIPSSDIAKIPLSRRCLFFNYYFAFLYLSIFRLIKH